MVVKNTMLFEAIVLVIPFLSIDNIYIYIYIYILPAFHFYAPYPPTPSSSSSPHVQALVLDISLLSYKTK